MELFHPLVEDYAGQYTSPENNLLRQINEDTYVHHAQPHMLSGHVQGRFLSFFSQLMQPKYILEIGTFTGYSALCLADGLAPDGELHTIELREEDVKISQANINQSPLADRIRIHQGNALHIIPTLDRAWDLVFIDADKTSYISYYDMLIEHLSPKGCILADNVLFHGQVLDAPIKGKSAKAIQQFNEYVRQDERSEQVLLTIRDGLLLIKKKQ